MAASLYRTETRYAANKLTMLRGTVADIVSVGVFHSLDPNEIPEVADFTTVTLVEPGDPLAEGDNIDVLSLIGPRAGQVVLAPGDWQRWVGVFTAAEDIMEPVDVVEVK